MPLYIHKIMTIGKTYFISLMILWKPVQLTPIGHKYGKLMEFNKPSLETENKHPKEILSVHVCVLQRNCKTHTCREMSTSLMQDTGLLHVSFSHSQVQNMKVMKQGIEKHREYTKSASNSNLQICRSFYT